jgi:hypothetical protein
VLSQLPKPLERDPTGTLKIAGKNLVFPGPENTQAFDADQLVKMLDEAQVVKAAVLSLAYFYGSPPDGPVENEYEKVPAYARAILSA